MAQEKSSLPYISSLLQSVEPRASGGAQKRKRGEEDAAHPLFPATALDQLVLDGMENEQVWQQLELRTAKLSKVLEKVMSSAVGEDDDDDEESSSSDDDALADSVGAPDDEGSDDEWEDEESDSSDEGFPGASDLSDVDPDEVFYEPLHSEEEQQKRKAEKERAEMMNMYNVSDPALFQALMEQEDGGEGSDDSDEDGDDGRASKSLLDQLEDDPEETSTSRQRRHPTLDDGFFSIDEFNRRTEAAERQGSTSRANLSGEDEEEDDGIDLFASVDHEDDESEEEEDDEDMSGADIMYSDFFDPPKKAPKTQRKERAPAPALKGAKRKNDMRSSNKSATFGRNV